MAKIIKCPSCGASDYEKIDETHYRCNFCESSFILEEKKKQTDINEFLKQFGRQTATQRPAAASAVGSAKGARSIVFAVSMVIAALGIGIAVFVNSTVNEALESAPGKMPEDSYWQQGSVQNFNVFEGSKGPVFWVMIQQSSKKLDSAKYTIQIIDPKKDKIIFESEYMRMTWNEGFNFRNYMNGMLSYKDKVYFLSDASGITVYDLYSGKRLLTSEQFAAKHNELKAGIVNAKDKYYKDAIELMTNDGFKFNFLPKFDLLVSEEEFNNYEKVTALTGGFVTIGEPRMKLYYVFSRQDTLRSDFSFSDYYLNQYLANGKAGSKKERAYEVHSEKVFFNVKYLLRNKDRVVFAYTENMDKKSASYIISYKASDLTKPDWEIKMSTIRYFEKAMAGDYYLRAQYSEKEIAVWYESAQKSACGIALQNGKVNWTYQVK
jgi:hypothetical protein